MRSCLLPPTQNPPTPRRRDRGGSRSSSGRAPVARRGLWALVSGTMAGDDQTDEQARGYPRGRCGIPDGGHGGGQLRKCAATSVAATTTSLTTTIVAAGTTSTTESPAMRSRMRSSRSYQIRLSSSSRNATRATWDRPGSPTLMPTSRRRWGRRHPPIAGAGHRSARPARYPD